MEANDLTSGWHPDALGHHQLRWWDGTRWTDHVSDDGVQAQDPPPTPPAPAVLDAAAVLVALPPVASETREVPLAVLSAHDHEPMGWVRYTEEVHNAAFGRTEHHRAALTDGEGRVLLGAEARHARGSARGGRRNDGLAEVRVHDGWGREVAQWGLTAWGGTSRTHLKVGGVKALSLERTVRTTGLGGAGPEISPVTLYAHEASVVGSIVQLGTRAGPDGAWLRLDRAPGLLEPQRTLTTLAPLVLLVTAA